MIVTSKSVLMLALLAVVLCFSFVEASPGKSRPKRSPTPCSSSPSPTSCTPTSVETKPGTLTFGGYPSGNLGDGSDFILGSEWGLVACPAYTRVCGTSTSTNLLATFRYPSIVAQNFSIVPRSPATYFTIFEITFTASDFGSYPSITLTITGVPITPDTALKDLTIVIQKPPYGQFYSSFTVDLVSAGYGAVKSLNFRAYYTGSSTGSFDVRVDGDGTGAGIRYEVYTPQGCPVVYRREDGTST